MISQAPATDHKDPRSAGVFVSLPHEPRVGFKVQPHAQGAAGELQVSTVPQTGSYAYIDIVYAAGNLTGGEIGYTCADFTISGRVLSGGRRSHSLAIPLPALRKSRTITFLSSAPLTIESAVLRRDYYDFMGLRSLGSAEAERKTAENERVAIERSATIGPSIQWFVTWKCNFACTYCWQEVAADQYRRGKANKIEPERWVERFHRLRPRDMYFTGGEPSLYKKLPELIALLDPSILLTMTSNLGGSLLVDKFIEYVKPDRFSELTFSIHPTQITVQEFFAKLGKMKAVGFRNLGVEMVLYPENLPFAAEVIERCRDLAVSAKFDPYVPASADSVPRDEKMMDEMRHWLDVANELTRKLGELSTFSFDKPQYFEVKPVGSETEQPAPCPSGKLPIFCTAGSRRVNVDEVGDVYTCMSAIDRSKLFDRLALPHYTPLGNLFDDQFRLLDRPLICWESFRCSACDFQMLDRAWTPVPGVTDQLPLPE